MLLYLLLSFCICANKCESSEHLGHCKANWSRRNKGICLCVTVCLSYEEGYSSKELFWRFCLLKFSVEHGADLLTLIRTVEQRMSTIMVCSMPAKGESTKTASWLPQVL